MLVRSQLLIKAEWKFFKVGRYTLIFWIYIFFCTHGCFFQCTEKTFYYVCPVRSKQKCLCHYLAPYLIVNRTTSVNNNFFQRTKMKLLLFIIACMHYNRDFITTSFLLLNEVLFDFRMVFPLTNGLRTKFKLSNFLEKKINDTI